ncbi:MULTISPECIES: CoA transferase [Streptomyces]|uniref:CoA transferase n=1 Tax=Streptomyces TaxID=1883 RepID=UPI00103CD12B|nr:MULTISPECIES: CoA transferase [Streptomyces]MBT3078077.1 CoA transferase [Streptomyces sp. COG21]MBT3084921.1 CoA transferase [Streptomyces sp. COG20]MBT3087061.1 CoA transferase [Streptomyces sp. CYG21]MBT3097213.1 CoA transferase [Streptomyces sp. CBG30]MBT3103132.1 CoA transferase [Streptomyces sp. COG19]
MSGLGPKAEHHLLELGLDPRPTPTGGWRLATAPGRTGPLIVEPRNGGAVSAGGLKATLEETVQAACGLMHLYGLREGTGPRRLGLDHTAVVRAVVTGQGALAGLLARARGLGPVRVRVDPAAALLLTLGHYLAVAEAAPDTYAPRPGPPERTDRAEGPDRTAFPPRADAGRPPPFLTRDGRWVEIETFRAHRWGALWQRLGAEGAAIGRAWREHAARQWTARCTMPESLHRAVAAHSLAELRNAAHACEVAVVELQPPDRYRPCARPWSSRTGPAPDTAAPVREPARTSPAHDLPLAGLTVVECTRFLQGPYAGRVLAMLGAHVVLVELPDGDPARGIEPVVDGCFAGFRALHRGKHPVRLDVTTPAGRDALRELLVTADVFLHNWPVGRAERLGLEPESIWRTHPRLICAHASGWAPFRGPLLPPVASDWSAQAHSGLAHAQRPDDEPPACSVATLLDTLGGLVCAEAVLAALLRRETTGVPTAVETSLLSAARLLLNGAKRPPAGPLFHPLPTGEGHLALGDTPRARSALGLPPGADRRAFAHALARDSAADWEERLNAAGAPCARVRSIHDVLTEPAFVHHLVYESGVHVTTPWEFS